MKKEEKDKKEKLWHLLFFVIGLLFPIAGIIMYFIYKKKKNDINATWCAFGATVGIAIMLLGGIIYLIGVLKNPEALKINVNKQDYVNKG